MRKTFQVDPNSGFAFDAYRLPSSFLPNPQTLSTPVLTYDFKKAFRSSSYSRIPVLYLVFHPWTRRLFSGKRPVALELKNRGYLPLISLSHHLHHLDQEVSNTSKMSLLLPLMRKGSVLLCCILVVLSTTLISWLQNFLPIHKVSAPTFMTYYYPLTAEYLMSEKKELYQKVHPWAVSSKFLRKIPEGPKCGG